MKTAVYSGSFDPLHKGHLRIMEYLTREGGFDCVYLIVSPQNPLKESGKALNAEKRYRDALEAVARHPELKVKVDDIELRMPPPNYSIRTLDALKRREPGNDFTLVIGADNLDNIHRWRDFPRILNEYGVVVYPRKGFDAGRIRETLYREMQLLPAPYVLDASSVHSTPGTMSLEEQEHLWHIRIIDAPIVDISSTRIREGIASGEDMSEWLM